MRLSPSQQKIVALLKFRPIRYLPKGATVENCMPALELQLWTLGGKWEWSWTILQETRTADYRKRISEINGMDGYTILSFHAPHKLEGGGTITRHGYILVAEPQTEGKAG